MSESIALGKSPESPEERRQLIAEHLMAEDYLAHLQASHIQKGVIDFLISSRGYSPGEIEINREFEVQLPGCSFTVRADLIVKVEGTCFLAIKCVMNSLESWERHSVAFCRVAGPCVIPYAAVTDGETVLLIETDRCTTVSGNLELLPPRKEAVRTLGTRPGPFPGERAEREKRILYAFDAIRCHAGPPLNDSVT
jgi:hypothetical protein